MPLWSGKPMPPAMNWACGYSPTPTAPECGAEAVWHGFKLTDEGVDILSMVAGCDEHREAVERNTDYVHPLVHPCGIPGSRFRWPENECHTDWDERQLLRCSVFVPAGAL